MYVAVPSVLHGLGRRDRWVIVRLDSCDQATWVGTCSHRECVYEMQARLASGSARDGCEHVAAAAAAVSECIGDGTVPGQSGGWSRALWQAKLQEGAISLDGCLAHVASGSSRWACGGLRLCEPCGFSKQDVEAESRSYVSAHTDESHPGAHMNEAEPKAAAEAEDEDEAETEAEAERLRG